MDFFDDDETGKAPARDRSAPPSPSRRRSDPRRTRLQRILILAAVLYSWSCSLIAWWARSCQQNRKVASYRAYFEGVSTAIDDSAALGKQLDQIVANPTKFSRKQLTAKLDELSAKQNEIAVRADRLEPPDTLAAEQAVFSEGMKVRADGFDLFETTLVGLLGKKNADPATLAALAGYFSGPDAYYTSRVYIPARNTLERPGRHRRARADRDVLPHVQGLRQQRPCEQMLNSVGSSTKLAGVHGVALDTVVVQPDDVTLTKTGTVSIPATADLAFDVAVMNQGDVTEEERHRHGTARAAGWGRAREDRHDRHHRLRQDADRHHPRASRSRPRRSARSPRSRSRPDRCPENG